MSKTEFTITDQVVYFSPFGRVEKQPQEWSLEGKVVKTPKIKELEIVTHKKFGGTYASYIYKGLLFGILRDGPHSVKKDIGDLIDYILEGGIENLMKEDEEVVKPKRLFLTLRREPFEQILAGYKLEEYRDIIPHYMKMFERSNYDKVLFQNGYSMDVPRMLVEVLGIEKKNANPDWCGGESPFVYAIKLGKVLEVKNLTEKQIKEIKANYRTEAVA